ncbi:ArsR/SmtB family transcription factor [Luteipulveratus mongoliensis]|uniref:ArsR/SmtB family transcription factor n=1 Tax=Luteipulveratus mongoliensis TaxID=571913 RepID=UPI001470642F|nr:helix-turn-helix domain-containing protein [Luteipulveratus mongoliensis]
MPRRTATERHQDTAPDQSAWPPEGTALIDALVAFHHPTRRRLYEALRMLGPSTVGQLSEATSLAPGSVSHHLKPLHRNGFIEPAPELARDTRVSCWRAVQRRLVWSSDDYPETSAAREVAEVVEQLNFEYQTQATKAWMSRRGSLPSPWNDLGFANDTYLRVTPEQMDDLRLRVHELVTGWTDACVADQEEQPDVERHPVRFVARGFPSDPTED